jgi:hypothetical protein
MREIKVARFFIYASLFPDLDPFLVEQRLVTHPPSGTKGNVKTRTLCARRKGLRHPENPCDGPQMEGCATRQFLQNLEAPSVLAPQDGQKDMKFYSTSFLAEAAVPSPGEVVAGEEGSLS